MISDRKLNIEYALIQGFYWMGFCVCVSFATVFLQGRGYSNFSLGLVLGLGNVLGFIASPTIASIVDKGGRNTVYGCLWGLIAVEIALLCSFLLIKGGGVLLSVLYCLYLACNTSVNPLNTQLNFELGGWTGRINYGLARGMGSLAFSGLAVFLGSFVKQRGADVLPYVGIALLILQALMLAVVFFQSKKAGTPALEKPSGRGAPLSTVAFIRANPKFSVLLLGMALLFFSHNIIGNFLINIVRNVGGDEAVMGQINGFMALTELPVMALYTVVARRIRCGYLLRFAAVMFICKAAAVALAPSVGWLYAAELLQCLSFAVLTPAAVQYTSLVVEPRDSAKGQALSAGMTTLGAAFAGGLGGLMYDSFSVKATLFIGVAIAAAGAFLCVLGIESRKR